MSGAKFIIRVLSLLGFTTAMNACQMMYGSPTADFEISGRVTSESGAALNNIRVVISPEHADTDFTYYDRQRDTVYTNRFGQFRINSGLWPSEGVYILRADDIDGAANNGDYQSDSTKIEIHNGDLKDGDGKWYMGKVAKTADLKLKPQK